MTRAILLVDHGSRRPDANEALECVARMVQHQAGDAVLVRFAHMELAEPDLPAALEACVAAGAMEVVVQPYMLSPGRHATEDIPRITREAAARHPSVRVQIGEPLGVHPLLGNLILSLAGVKPVRNAARTDAEAGSGCTLDPKTCREPWCGPGVR